MPRRWNPATINADWLPWLAYGLSVDSWDADWSEAEKRAAVAGSIALHRIKGTRASVEIVLARFDALARVVEWHEASPRAAPHTFDVMLPMVTAPGAAPGGTRSSAAFAEAIIREVSRVKPLREHFRVAQRVDAGVTIGVVGAARAAIYRRDDCALVSDQAPIWSRYLQTEDGEPFEDDFGDFLEDAA
jgi:phage tail P2-like protein